MPSGAPTSLRKLSREESLATQLLQARQALAVRAKLIAEQAKEIAELKGQLMQASIETEDLHSKALNKEYGFPDSMQLKIENGERFMVVDVSAKAEEAPDAEASAPEEAPTEAAIDTQAAKG